MGAVSWAGAVFSLVGDWGWLGGIAGGGAWLVARFVLGRPWWTSLAALAGIAFALWWAIDEVQDITSAIREEGRRAGIAECAAANQKAIDALRAERDAEAVKTRIAEERLALARSILEAKDRADIETAIREAADAASKDPACAPSPASIRLWNDAIDRANGAAGGSGRP